MNKIRKNIVFIINPNSGLKRPKQILRLLEKELDNHFEWEALLTERAHHATDLAAKAVKAGADAVIAVGGDGTINEVSRALIGSETALGVIPTGSGNGFARHLKIPLRKKEALNRIMRLKTIKIDTAKVNGESFLTTAGLGFDAEVGWRFSEFNRRGLPAYMRATADTFLKFKPETFQLTVDGKKLDTRAFLVTIANAGQYGNNAWIAPSASLTDGQLNVCILKEFPPQRAPEILFRLFNKQIEASKFYEMISAKEIVVKNPGKYHLDGEPLVAEEDLIIEVDPRSLNVII